MNLLRNPMVVGALTVAAVGVLIYDLATESRPAKTHDDLLGRSVPIPAAKPSRAQPASDLDQPVTPQLELRALEANAARWGQAPRRDPFRSRFDAQTQAARFLSLKAIWRQTEGALAVINDRVVAEGDRVLDFSVEKIESDRVWVSGPNGREDLVFKLSGPPLKAQHEPGSSP